jgi:putative component of toxin-antitoxin plasmid stabilization module
MEVQEKQIKIYKLPNGRIPYLEWFYKLKDQRAKQKIEVQIGRLRLGN